MGELVSAPTGASASAGAHRHGLDAAHRSPAVDAEPPLSPHLVRAPEVQQIRGGFVETLLFKGISTPVALMLVVVQGRFLHTSGRGTFVLVILSVTILSRLLGQLGYAVTNQMQEHGLELRRLVHGAFATGLLLGAGGTAAIVAWGSFTPGVGGTVAAVAACALVPTILWQCLAGVLLGLGRIRTWNVVQTLPPLLTLAGMLVLVVGLAEGITGAVAAWSLAQIVTALVGLVRCRAFWRPFAIRRALALFSVPLARLALTMGAVQVVALISYRVELFVLNRYRDISHVGVYSVAVQTAEILWLVAGAIATAVTAPCLQQDEKRAASLITRSALKALAYTAIISLGLGAAAPFVIPRLLGDAFTGAVEPLRLLLPGIVVYAPVTVLVVYLSVKRGRPSLSLAISIVGMIVTLVAAMVLIPAHGTSGAALASTLGYLASAALAWALLMRTQGTTPRPRWARG
jgi:O-antigen/teichoic acid export membrane protein